MNVNELKTIFMNRVDKLLQAVRADRNKQAPKDRKLSPTSEGFSNITINRKRLEELKN